MSDLQCPATLILARHGAAAYSADGGSLTTAGRRYARDLAAALSERHVAHVYSHSVGAATGAAEIVAAALDVEVTAMAIEPSGGDTSAELRAVIEEISDLHRGETVLLVLDRELWSRDVTRLIGTTGGPPPPPDERAMVQLAVDADGMVCTAWVDHSVRPDRCSYPTGTGLAGPTRP